MSLTVDPLVSIVIVCYNQAHYLEKAIRSAQEQSYPHTEVILVDDGSTDATREVAGAFSEVQYIFQENRGLPAARNRGLDSASGEYILFLDADDWLLTEAVAVNTRYLGDHPELAFVSGAHQVYMEATGEVWLGRRIVTSDHYQEMLSGNYIGMTATVLFRKAILEQFRFDESLPACEDYDLFLRITRQYPVMHHTKLLTVYRKHGQNMSGNPKLMRETSLQILERQREWITAKEDQDAIEQGRQFWKRLYAPPVVPGLHPVKKLKNLLRNIYHRLPRWWKSVRHNRLDWGDLDRITPVSTHFGFDRGLPVDRHYIENFLGQHRHQVRGRVLEIGDNEYTYRYGGLAVSESEILHIDATNPLATWVGSLSDCPHIPSDRFDCIILTQTLHLIWDFQAALENCRRILKPGGTLLLTVPGITNISHDHWSESWYWSFTELSVKKLLADCFSGGEISLQTFGNVASATAFLYGLAKHEVTEQQLEYSDPHYSVIIAAAATK